ncbi:uncharacterized protein LOC125544583 [Triticum urartu]|uniref:uncharacterized protein LOC125544583 n=1 Tax=Triticum urartu TaxID=4572 RepID=UPI002043E6EB|nr:uncharacterized protein LOC125544583 [Triticum urartu]
MKRNEHFDESPEPKHRKISNQSDSSVLPPSTEWDANLDAPPVHYPKNKKIDTGSDSSLPEPAVLSHTEAFTTGNKRGASKTYQNGPIPISESSGTNGDLPQDPMDDSYQMSISNQSQRVRKLHRRELVDFLIRDTEAISCQELMTFIGESPSVEVITIPGAVAEIYGKDIKPSDTLKHASLKLANYFSALQLSGWSLCGKFKISDILVTPLGDIRMRTSMLRSLRPQSHRRNRKDFRCLARMFLKLLEGVNRIPDGYILFLKRLKIFSEKDRLLVTHYPANMTEQERLSLLDKLYRSYEALPENDERLKVITAGVPYCDPEERGHWFGRARTNVFLTEVLEYRNPPWLALPANNDKPLFPPTGRGVLKHCRNSVQHAFKGMGTEILDPKMEERGENKDTKKKKRRPPKKQRKKLGKPVRVQKFRAIQVDHMIRKAYPGLLCKFTELMSDAGLLEELIQFLALPISEAPARESER